jgi:aldose 1-epimerase
LPGPPSSFLDFPGNQRFSRAAKRGISEAKEEALMSVSVAAFGTYEGQQVDQFTLVSDTGVEVDIISYGVVVRDWRVPVAGGKRSVVLGFENFDWYPLHSPHFGSLAGRVANRIAGSSFELDGKTFDLVPNEGNLSLHGGPKGLGYQVWKGEIDSANNAVSFAHHSPDGAMGYPGNVDFVAVYTLKGNRLRLDISATTDAKTPINVVQHQYFNLGTTDTILDHTFQINANAYTPTGEDLVPTGVIQPVAGTPFDLQKPQTLRKPDGSGLNFDTNLVLNGGRDFAEPIATVVGPDGALTFKLWSDQPGVQFYNGVYTDIPVPGLNGKHYGNNSGFCLEDQAFPDAVHQAHFPSIIVSPGKPYSHFCEIEIA